jgi:hypothetical protein
MTSREVARSLNIPLRTLTDWRYLGKHLRYYTLGNTVRYDANEVAEFLQRHLHDEVDATITARERVAVRRHLEGVLGEIRGQVLEGSGAIAAFLVGGGLGAYNDAADWAEERNEDAYFNT